MLDKKKESSKISSAELYLLSLDKMKFLKGKFSNFFVSGIVKIDFD